MLDERSYNRKREEKRKKTKKAREQFMLFVLMLAMIPTILAIILFAKQTSLQNQVEVLEKQLEQLQERDGAAVSGQQGDTSEDAGVSGIPPAELTPTPLVSPTPILSPTSSPSLTPSPSPSPSLSPTPSPTPEPTLAVDLETGELLPWAEKKVYLTFDDGPSKNTDALLDLLAEYDMKVTFFVMGKDDAESKRLYKRIVDEGHSLGIHSYSHDYEKIYKSVEDFEKDFTKISDLLYDTIGYVPKLYRFPGGSSNSRCKELTIQPFIHYLVERDIRYYDWNVENGDATGVSYTVEELAENVLGAVAKKKTSMVLCHDTAAKTKTIQSMEIVLAELKAKGAQVLPITEDTPMVRHVLPEEPVIEDAEDTAAE